MATHLLAQITNPVLPAAIGSGGIANGSTVVGKIIGTLVGAILVAAFLLAFFYLITGGVSWITSGGDKNQLETARNKITNAIIGLIIAFAVYAIMSLLGTWLGIGFPTMKFPTLK
jgi:hypothetical protein